MDLETMFWAFAVVGTTLFVARSALIFGGLGSEDGGTGDFYHDTDTPGGTEHGLQVISLYTLTVFFMMAGWSGLALQVQLKLGEVPASIGAFVIGAGSMVGIASLMRSLMKLQSSGATYDLASAVGTTGTVYQRITADQRGVIQIALGGTLREVLATSDETLESETVIEVTGIQGTDTLVVKKAH